MMNENDSENSQLYITNVVIGLITASRLAGEEQIKSLLGIEKIPTTMKPILKQEVIDRKLINPLAALKKQVREVLIKHGSREPLLGWVVNPESVDALMQEILILKEKYENLKLNLLANYEASCRTHIEKLRIACLEDGLTEEQANTLCKVIENEQPHQGYLEKQLDFRYIKPRGITLDSKEYSEICNSIYGQVLSDITAKCKESLRGVRNRPKLRVLIEVAGKSNGLVYLDPRFEVMAGKIEELIGKLPPETQAEKDWDSKDQFALIGVIEMLSNRRRLQEFLEIESMDDMLKQTNGEIDSHEFTTLDQLSDQMDILANEEIDSHITNPPPGNEMNNNTVIVETFSW